MGRFRMTNPRSGEASTEDYPIEYSRAGASTSRVGARDRPTRMGRMGAVRITLLRSATTTPVQRPHHRPTQYLTLAAVLALLVALFLTGCTPPQGPQPGTGALFSSSSPAPTVTTSVLPTPPPDPQSSGPSPSDTGSPGRVEADERSAYATAREATLALAVKGRAPKTGYARDEFGSGWIDVDRNGCDTRNDMLKKRLTDLTMSGPCKVMSGTLDDPFTGVSIEFIRGGTSEVDVDHLVALSDAWQKGAAQWDFATRVAFANDPLNLEPVDSSANRQKGDSDAATWLPPNKAYRCHYVARQVAVKTKYGLWVTQAEQAAILRVLDTCPQEPLPSPGDHPVVATHTGVAPPSVSEGPRSEPPAATALDERFAYCKDLPPGYGPYVRGVHPEYEWYTDRDGDGVVCE